MTTPPELPQEDSKGGDVLAAQCSSSKSEPVRGLHVAPGAAHPPSTQKDSIEKVLAEIRKYTDFPGVSHWLTAYKWADRIAALWAKEREGAA